MLEPNVFVTRWNAEVAATNPGLDSPLVRADADIAAHPIPLSAAAFLIEAGLPQDCAPFLSFRAVSEDAPPLPEYFALPSSDRLARFRVIGSDGAGNPLCIDTAADGTIIMLDHEDRFVTTQFVASSIAALAEALLLLHTLPRRDFLAALHHCDPPAAHPDAFLPREFAMLHDA